MSSGEEIKVVFLGESMVGKTNILSQFIDGKFNPESQQSLTAQFFRKKISLPDKSTISIDLWDTAGLEKYRNISKIFFKDAKAVILVYDSTNEKSFKELKEYWYNQVKDLKQVLAIVANKCDLAEKKVKDEEGKEFADSVGAIFASVSAKENIGITELIQKVGEAIKKEEKN